MLDLLDKYPLLSMGIILFIYIVATCLKHDVAYEKDEHEDNSI